MEDAKNRITMTSGEASVASKKFNLHKAANFFYHKYIFGITVQEH